MGWFHRAAHWSCDRKLPDSIGNRCSCSRLRQLYRESTWCYGHYLSCSWLLSELACPGLLSEMPIRNYMYWLRWPTGFATLCHTLWVFSCEVDYMDCNGLSLSEESRLWHTFNLYEIKQHRLGPNWFVYVWTLMKFQRCFLNWILEYMNLQ